MQLVVFRKISGKLVNEDVIVQPVQEPCTAADLQKLKQMIIRTVFVSGPVSSQQNPRCAGMQKA